MANLTISVDEDTLRRARIRAIQRGESVNAYLADALRRYAAGANGPDVFAELIAIADEHGTGADASGRTWRRDELHRV